MNDLQRDAWSRRSRVHAYALQRRLILGRPLPGLPGLPPAFSSPFSSSSSDRHIRSRSSVRGRFLETSLVFIAHLVDSFSCVRRSCLPLKALFSGVNTEEFGYAAIGLVVE